MHADSYIISYLFVVVFIISFNFFDGDSASPTAQLEWGLRIIYWRSVLELLTLNYENLMNLQAAETGPSAPKNYA